MSQNNSSNNLVAPNSRGALEQLKYEVAQELGITLSQMVTKAIKLLMKMVRSVVTSLNVL